MYGTISVLCWDRFHQTHTGAAKWTCLSLVRLLNCNDDIVFVSGADGVALYVDDVSGTLFSDTQYPGCVSIEMAIA